MHLKRNKIPTTWPLARKGTKYVVVPEGGIRNAIPLLVVLRDMLNIGETKREIKKILQQGSITINGNAVKNEKMAVTLNDTLSIKTKGDYKLTYTNNGKFTLEKIKAEELTVKITKVTGKKALRSGRIQVSLLDGRNIITKEAVKVGNSVLVDMKDKKIKKVMETKKDSEIIVVGGKHLGKKGIVEEIIDENNAIIAFKDKKIKLDRKNIMLIK